MAIEKSDSPRQVTIDLKLKISLMLPMKFSESEVEKAKELKRLKLADRAKIIFEIGNYFWGRQCPTGYVQVGENIFLLTGSLDDNANLVWLPTFDEILRLTPALGISFSQITDYLHRRRFADGREREGLYQLLIEKLR